MDRRQKENQYQGHGGDDPEGLKKLWWGVAAQAAKDLHDPEYGPGARRWFLSDRVEVGSFLWICDHTGLNDTVIRRAVLNNEAKKFIGGRIEGEEN